MFLTKGLVSKILLKNNFNIYQEKIILLILSGTSQNINLSLIEDYFCNIAGINIKATKVINELKKIDHSLIAVTLHDTEIHIEIDNLVFYLHKDTKVNSQVKIIKKIDEKESRAEILFDYWKDRMSKVQGRTRKTKFKTYKSTIVGTMENYTDEEIKQAIDGCSRSLFHMGYNEDGTVHGKYYDELDLILRPKKIDSFIRKANLKELSEQLKALSPVTKMQDDRDEWLESRKRLLGGGNK